MATYNISRQSVSGDKTDALIELFTLAPRDRPKLHFTNARIEAGHVNFNGQKFLSFPLAAKGFKWSVEGPPARPILELSNIAGLFDKAVEDDWLRGVTVQRILTFVAYLDRTNGYGGGGCFPPESWVVDRVARLDDRIIRLELVGEASLENRQFPARVMLRNLCQHRYRHWDPVAGRFDYVGVTCPYTGDRYFGVDGKPVRKPAADRCSLSLETGCRKRFAGSLPFLGFPGVTRG